MQLERQSLFIAGERVPAGSGERFVSLNPAAGQPLCEVDHANERDVDRAVAAARAAFPAWAGMGGAARGRILRRAAALLREHRDELARLEVLDTGKPISEALVVDVDSGADCLDYFAGLAAAIAGEHVDLGGQTFFYTRREPLGACAGIGAWNYPLQIACWKSAPALACGNTMVLKPSELTSVMALRLAEIYAEAGLPPGVFNVVQGDARTGQALVRHPGVAKVSLTGEASTGSRVMADAAATLKQVTLELSGKSPLIVFGDAELDNAVSAAMLANFYTQGEVCSNGTRVFVERGLHNAFIDRLLARTERMVVGDPLDPATHVGALISREHMERVLGYVAAGREARARLLCGGEQVTVHGCEGGWFVRPAVLTGCDDAMSIVREEIFGPVMSVLTFDGEDEVVARANDTEYASRPACSRATSPAATGSSPASRPAPAGSTTTTSPSRDAVRRLQALRPRPGERHRSTTPSSRPSTSS